VDILGVWRLCPSGVQGYSLRSPDLCPWSRVWGAKPPETENFYIRNIFSFFADIG